MLGYWFVGFTLINRILGTELDGVYELDVALPQ